MSHRRLPVRISSDHQFSLPLESRLPANNLAGVPRGLGPFSQPNSNILPCSVGRSCRSTPVLSSIFLQNPERISHHDSTDPSTSWSVFFSQRHPPSPFTTLFVPTPGSPINLHHLYRTPTRTVILFRASHSAFTRQFCKRQNSQFLSRKTSPGEPMVSLVRRPPSKPQEPVVGAPSP